MPRWRAIAFLTGAIVVGACTSTVKNTPRQDLIWSAYNQCKGESRVAPNVQITRVEPDGRVWYTANRSSYGSQELERCINEKISPPPIYVPVVSQ
jgi:streptogramin lyase